MTNKSQQYIARLNTLTSEYNEKVNQLADEYRERVLVPLCKKKNLVFYSGNGTFFFLPVKFDDGSYLHPGENIENRTDAEEKKKSYLLPVFDVLYAEVGDRFVFGFYMSNVDPRKLDK